MDANVRVFMEPRGFIRVIQFVFSIFAFATTGGFSTNCSLQAKCENPDKTFLYPYTVEYAFRRLTIEAGVKCNSTDSEIYTLPHDFSSSAQFFVATGVLSFLYTLGISGVYALAYRLYESNQMVPIVDLGVSAVLTIFWISGASAWAQGVADVKHYTQATVIAAKRIKICEEAMCTQGTPCKFATLNVSLIFGFANFALWAASLWFIYKETIFHQQPQTNAGQVPPAQNFPSQDYPPQQYPPPQYSPTETKLGGQI